MRLLPVLVPSLALVLGETTQSDLASLDVEGVSRLLVEEWSLPCLVAGFEEMHIDGRRLTQNLRPGDITDTVKAEFFPRCIELHWRELWDHLAPAEPVARQLDAVDGVSNAATSGIAIKHNNSAIEFGTTGDARIYRSGEGALSFSSDITVEGVCTCASDLLLGGQSLSETLASINDVLQSLIEKVYTLVCGQSLDIVSHFVNSTFIDSPRALSLGANDTGTHVYMTALDSNTLVVIDVEDPEQPELVGVVSDLQNLEGPAGVAASPQGDIIFVTGRYSDSLAAVNISDPSNPHVVGVVSDSTNMENPADLVVSADGNYVYVAAVVSDSIVVVGVSDPTQPTVLGVISDSTNLDGAHGIGLSPDGNYVYVAGAVSDSIAVVDVTDPTSPVIVGAITGDSTNMNAPHGLGVDPAGKYVYVVGRDSDSFAVVDVQSPSDPFVVGSIVGNVTHLDGPRKAAVAPDGSVVYVTVGSSDSLAIVDVENPARPTVVLSVDELDFAWGLALSAKGDYAYVGTINDDSLVIVETCETY